MNIRFLSFFQHRHLINATDLCSVYIGIPFELLQIYFARVSNPLSLQRLEEKNEKINGKLTNLQFFLLEYSGSLFVTPPNMESPVILKPLYDLETWKQCSINEYLNKLRYIH
jgi:hypothetical protein